MIFESQISGQEEYCLSYALILSSRNQSIVNNRKKIECASDVVDVMDFFHSHNISSFVESITLFESSEQY